MAEIEMKQSKLKKWLKDEYQRYCTFSSISTMHGYTELYSAKTLFFKCVWIAIIVASIAITGYQVNEAVYQYIYQSSYSKIAPAIDDDVIYPPLKICLPHWIMWVDYRKMDTYFSKNATLYSLSYLTNIYSIDEFDIEAARKEFISGFAKSNFTDLFDYYAQLALPPATWIRFGHYEFEFDTNEYERENIDKNYINTMFHVEWANTQSEYPVFCCTADGSSIKKYLTEGYKNVSIQTTEKNNVHFYLQPMSESIMYVIYDNWRYYADSATKKYIDEWQMATKYPLPKNPLEEMEMPDAVLIDGFTDHFTFLSAEQETVTFTVKTSANIWLSTTANQCVNEKFIDSNKTCQQSCSKKYYVEDDLEATFYFFKNNCSLLLQSFYVKNYKDDLAKLCRHLFYFGTNSTIAKIDAAIDQDGSWAPERIDPLKVRYDLSQPLIAECSSNCTVYCENWKYEIGKSYSSGTVFIPTLTRIPSGIYPQVIIEYPAAGQILILTEMDSQTWENFISNIGGLLGIWTGASILSFIQLFYLCCCVGIDEAYTPKWFRLKKIHAAKTHQQHIHPPKIPQPEPSRFQYIP